MKRHFWGGAVLCLLILGSAAFGQLVRQANTTLRMPQTLPAKRYALQQVFGRTFSQPVALATPPGETGRIFIVEQVGRISVITNLTQATPTVLTFLDWRTRTQTGGEQGLLGLAFHPRYAENGYFYIFYTAPGPLRDRLSRFTVSANDPNSANASSEQIIIDQVDEAGNHNGGDLHFGPDGYLYVSLGDEGGGGDQYANSQRIDKDFFAGILRIDVDKKSGNLQPNAHPAVTANYLVPADNPFVGATSFNGLTVNPANVRTEFWAVGLRNPWRMSFDSETGTLWCGDVGQGAREEVDIITKGGNYGWNYREGLIAYGGTPPSGFQEVKPIVDYPRTNNHVSITGGRVYRGARMPELRGAYIYADYGGGSVWALRLNDGRPVVETLLNEGGLSAFGVDPSNGDILTCDVATGHIRRLTYATGSTGQLPPTLAETGAFSDLATLTPNAGIVRYELNLPFWSDNALKTRWFSITNLTDKFTFDPLQTWTTPVGAVWIKHFDIEMTRGDANSKRRLETRFIVRNSGGMYGVTYRWTNATSAVLVPEEGMNETLQINDGGTVREQVWRYPSWSECMACHTPAANWILGFNTPQLNRDVTHGTQTSNQIEALAAAGYLNNASASADPHLALARPEDATASQEFRVRSYLAANCSQCHRPGSAGLGNFDARISTATDDAGLINGALIDTQGDAANRTLVPNDVDHSMILKRMSIRGPGQMPPIASNIPDPAGVELLRNFILGDLKNRQSYAQWQEGKFSEPASAAAEADPDQDRASNELEYLTGTNPLQAGDGWGIRAEMGANGLTLRFQNPANRAVVIETATALTGPWTALDDEANRPLFPATAGERSLTGLDSDGEARYYRARLTAP